MTHTQELVKQLETLPMVSTQNSLTGPRHAKFQIPYALLRDVIERLTAPTQWPGEEEIARALEPFVVHYQPWMEQLADHEPMSIFPRHTMGDLRRARAILALRGPVSGEAERDADRLWRAMNGMDIDDGDKLAEHIMKQSLDGLQIGPQNRAGVKAMLAQHFNNLMKQANPAPLTGQEKAGAVPDGWKLVPVEPSYDLVLAGSAGIAKAFSKIHIGTNVIEQEFEPEEFSVHAREGYRAMLSAAPQPPKGTGE